MLLSLTAALILPFAGCFTYTPPPVATSEDNFTGLPEKTKQTLPTDAKVLTLTMCEHIAVKNNPDFLSRKYAVTAAWAVYYQRLANYLPTVTASYGISQTITNPNNQKNFITNKSNSFDQQFQVGAQWLVFDGFIRTFNALAAKYSAKQQEELEQDSRRLLLRSVAQQYYNVLLAIENNRIAKADMEFQNKMLTETQLKYDAGAVPLSDVLNFKIKVNDAESAMISAQYNYNTARYALARLMGLTEVTLPDWVQFPPMSSSTGQQLADIGVYLDTALNNRPDLQAYRDALQIAKYNLYAAYGAFSPTVTASAAYTYSINKTRWTTKGGGTVFAGKTHYDSKSRTPSFTYGGEVTWTLFQGGARFARVYQTQALVAQSEYELAEHWLKVIEEVRTAYDNYIQNSKLAVLYEKTLGLVTKQRDLVEEEYKAGNTELTRLNEAQNDLTNADANLVQALINVKDAMAQLESVTNTNRIGAPQQPE